MAESQDIVELIAQQLEQNGATDLRSAIAFTLGFADANSSDTATANNTKVDSRIFGFIGIGTINSAVVRGLLTYTDVPMGENTIVLSPRNAARSAALAKEFPKHVRVAASNQEVLDASEVVFIATPPGNDNTRAALTDLNFREDQLVVSIIAGAAREVLLEVCAPCPTVVQAVPLPPAEHHRSTTVVFPEHDGVQEIFERVGKAVVVPDAAKATAVASISCIMGDFYARIRAAHEWLVSQGVDSEAASSAVSSAPPPPRWCGHN